MLSVRFLNEAYFRMKLNKEDIQEYNEGLLELHQEKLAFTQKRLPMPRPSFRNWSISKSQYLLGH
jgi:hypothetical protein